MGTTKEMSVGEYLAYCRSGRSTRDRLAWLEANKARRLNALCRRCGRQCLPHDSGWCFTCREHRAPKRKRKP